MNLPNLPNALTIGRILAAPCIAVLPFQGPWALKFAGFVMFIAAAVTDYYDGMFARTRNLVTNVGKLLDPLADKLLLIATLVPMYVLMASPSEWPADELAGSLARLDGAFDHPFVTPFGDVPLPFWILAIVLGREVFMILFRHFAARRGVIISAIGPAKWKTAMQSIWVGSAYFWFGAAAAAAQLAWSGRAWTWWTYFNGLVGTISMYAALGLTLYSLWLYLHRYGYLLTRSSE